MSYVSSSLFGSNPVVLRRVGVVELTVALHHVFNTPDDRIVWDVGHQCYHTKCLPAVETAWAPCVKRWIKRLSKAQRKSSIHLVSVIHLPVFQPRWAWHCARQRGIDRKVVAVIRDGAITGGMAFEALAHAGHERPNML